MRKIGYARVTVSIQAHSGLVSSNLKNRTLDQNVEWHLLG